MFELLLTLCLASDPTTCRTERLPGGETRAACLAEAAATLDRLREERRETPQQWPCIPKGTTPGFPMTEVAPGIFVHKGAHAEQDAENMGDIANIGFVIGERSVAVIDPGGSAAIARDLLAAIRARTDLPVSHAIVTHMHPDHALGASVFREAGATVLGHANLARALAARADSYLQAGTERVGEAFAGTEVALPETKVERPHEIDLGDRVLEIEPHPTAHTDNDLTVLDRKTGTWFLGDLLFVDHLPVIDGSLRGWMALLPELARRPAERAVPGHGPVAVPWPEAASSLLRYLDRLTGDASAAVAQGVPLSEAAETVGQEAADGWLLAPLHGPRNAVTAYRELEWE